MTETLKDQTALPTEPEVPKSETAPAGTAVAVKTELFRAFLQFGEIITTNQILRFSKELISLKSRSKGNTGMCVIETKNPFNYTGEIGISLSQLIAALPKTAEVTITPGKKITIEATDYRANLITTALTDPDLVMTRLKDGNDFRTQTSNGFIVGAKDFLDKVSAMRTAFAKGEYFLTLLSDEKTPEEITLSADDNAVGDVKYRITTGGGKPETWSRAYDYELLQPILKMASTFCQEIKVSWMMVKQGNETFAAIVISGTTPDGLITFSYVLAPRVAPIKTD
jgi:hypothetical protein